MNSSSPNTPYTAPPKPPLNVRFDKFKQFFLYEIRRSWKTRTASLIVFLLTLSMLWWVYGIRAPYIIAEKNNILTPEIFQTNIQELEDKRTSLEAEATATALQLMEQSILDGDTSLTMQNQTLEEIVLSIGNQHIINDYVGISELLEHAVVTANSHHLTLTYQLSTPTPAQLLYSDDLYDVAAQIQLVPEPGLVSTQTWKNIMQHLHDMLMQEKKFNLQSIHISTSNQQINQVSLHVNMLVTLDKLPVEPTP